ncbi:MAG: hypothetical protein OXP28_11395 [Gammaproteobacteria bacterium]|nr:hypothetical protein [Gammaproteobacteria bacterium]
MNKTEYYCRTGRIENDGDDLKISVTIHRNDETPGYYYTVVTMPTDYVEGVDVDGENFHEFTARAVMAAMKECVHFNDGIPDDWRKPDRRAVIRQKRKDGLYVVGTI